MDPLDSLLLLKCKFYDKKKSLNILLNLNKKYKENLEIKEEIANLYFDQKKYCKAFFLYFFIYLKNKNYKNLIKFLINKEKLIIFNNKNIFLEKSLSIDIYFYIELINNNNNNKLYINNNINNFDINNNNNNFDINNNKLYINNINKFDININKFYINKNDINNILIKLKNKKISKRYFYSKKEIKNIKNIKEIKNYKEVNIMNFNNLYKLSIFYILKKKTKKSLKILKDIYFQRNYFELLEYLLYKEKIEILYFLSKNNFFYKFYFNLAIEKINKEQKNIFIELLEKNIKKKEHLDLLKGYKE